MSDYAQEYPRRSTMSDHGMDIPRVEYVPYFRQPQAQQAPRPQNYEGLLEPPGSEDYNRGPCWTEVSSLPNSLPQPPTPRPQVNNGGLPQVPQVQVHHGGQRQNSQQLPAPRVDLRVYPHYHASYDLLPPPVDRYTGPTGFEMHTTSRYTYHEREELDAAQALMQMRYGPPVHHDLRVDGNQRDHANGANVDQNAGLDANAAGNDDAPASAAASDSSVEVPLRDDPRRLRSGGSSSSSGSEPIRRGTMFERRLRPRRRPQLSEGSTTSPEALMRPLPQARPQPQAQQPKPKRKTKAKRFISKKPAKPAGDENNKEDRWKPSQVKRLIDGMLAGETWKDIAERVGGGRSLEACTAKGMELKKKEPTEGKVYITGRCRKWNLTTDGIAYYDSL